MSESVKPKGDDRYAYWDVDINASDAAFARLMRAMVVTGTKATDHFTLYPDMVREKRRGVSVFFRVRIYKGREEEFKTLAGVELRPPPRITLNSTKGVSDDDAGGDQQ